MLYFCFARRLGQAVDAGKTGTTRLFMQHTPHKAQHANIFDHFSYALQSLTILFYFMSVSTTPITIDYHYKSTIIQKEWKTSTNNSYNSRTWYRANCSRSCRPSTKTGPTKLFKICHLLCLKKQLFTKANMPQITRAKLNWIQMPEIKTTWRSTSSCSSTTSANRTMTDSKSTNFSARWSHNSRSNSSRISPIFRKISFPHKMQHYRHSKLMNRFLLDKQLRWVKKMPSRGMAQQVRLPSSADNSIRPIQRSGKLKRKMTTSSFKYRSPISFWIKQKWKRRTISLKNCSHSQIFLTPFVR